MNVIFFINQARSSRFGPNVPSRPAVRVRALPHSRSAFNRSLKRQQILEVKLQSEGLECRQREKNTRLKASPLRD